MAAETTCGTPRGDSAVPLRLRMRHRGVVSPETVFDEARQRGWALADANIEELIDQVVAKGWTIVPTRRGSDPIARLRPIARTSAAERSLSGKYGLSAFPLHSDGAHLRQPPDYVVLAADSASRTPTLLWCEEISHVALQDDLRHGVFRVSGGDRPFLAVAYDGDRLRFDPGCMLPLDRRSRRVSEYFSNAVERASRHYWSGGGQVVVIDNRRALHARGDATGDEMRSLRRVMLRKSGAP